MQSNIGRVALGVVVAAAAVVLFLLLQDDDAGRSVDERTSAQPEETATGGDSATRPQGRQKPSVPTIVVSNGKPVGGVEELSFEAGEPVRFKVRSNVADELHVHGYDVEEELPAGRMVRVEFPATIEGIFEAELHGSGEQIAELRVEP